MSSLAGGSETLETSQARRQNALSILLLFCAASAFLLRFTMSVQTMNRLVPYTTDGGPFYAKLHFGTYAIFLLLVVVLFSRPFLLHRDEIGLFKAMLFFSASMFGLVAYLFAAGHANASGFVIDAYAVASAAGLVMLGLNTDTRRRLGDVVLAMLILSAFIGIIEAVTQHRFMPYSEAELAFRPIGLSSHPLSLGGSSATAIGFVALTNWRMWLRLSAIFILFVGCAASGARTALMLASGEVLILLLFVRWPGLSPKYERQAKFVVLLFTLAGGAALVAALFAGGLLDRFGDTLFDANFMSRITIYQVFSYVSWKDIFLGMDGGDLLKIVNEKLNLPFIESAPVVIIMMFGLPAGLLFSALILWFIFRLLRGAAMPAWIGTMTYLLASLSNNALTSKTPDITMLVVLLLAYRNPLAGAPSTASGPDRNSNPRTRTP
nr:VpsF family polysaccharide biosynthesis protein [Mesorhizobium loti]